MEFFTFNSPEERGAKMQAIANRAGARTSFAPEQIDRIELGPDEHRPLPIHATALAGMPDQLHEMATRDRLQFLVEACDYRGKSLGILPGCCGGEVHHCLLRKGNPGMEHAVTLAMCYACVSGSR